MSKKKESFVLTAMPEDLGVKQYGFVQGGKKEETGKPSERKKLWLSPGSIYLFVIAAFLVFWCVYTLAVNVARDGTQAIVGSLVDFFALGVCLLIIFVSVFRGWSKFARFALNHGLVKNKDRAPVESSAEMMDEVYEKLESAPSVFEVYENYILATCGAGVKVFDRSQVGRIIAYKAHGQCLINVVPYALSSDEIVLLKDLRLPLREVNRLKAVLGDTLSIEPLLSAEQEKVFGKSDLDVNWAGIIMGLIAVVAGGGVLALHYTLAESIPVALGAFFMAVGTLVLFTGFASLPIVKLFVIPLLAGGIFTVIPFLFCKLIAGEESVSFIFSSAHNFFSSFNALYCLAAFLTAIGLLGVVWAFICLVKYIKYGDY